MRLGTHLCLKIIGMPLISNFLRGLQYVPTTQDKSAKYPILQESALKLLRKHAISVKNLPAAYSRTDQAQIPICLTEQSSKANTSNLKQRSKSASPKHQGRRSMPARSTFIGA